jgi:hypothetical protein
LEAFSCASTLIPGGAMGVRLKSYLPWSCSQADNFGLIRDPLSKFKVSLACGIVLSHRRIGKESSMDHHPAFRWLLAVRMACSATFVRWSWGGANWYWTPFLWKNSLTSWGHSLSSRWNCGLHPPLVSVACTWAMVAARTCAVLFLNGCRRMQLLS